MYGSLRLNHSVEHVCFFPCVLVNRLNGVRGGTHMFAEAMRRTASLFRDNGVSQDGVDNLKDRPHPVDGVAIALTVHGHVC